MRLLLIYLVSLFSIFIDSITTSLSGLLSDIISKYSFIHDRSFLLGSLSLTFQEPAIEGSDYFHCLLFSGNRSEKDESLLEAGLIRKVHFRENNHNFHLPGGPHAFSSKMARLPSGKTDTIHPPESLEFLHTLTYQPVL